MALEVRPIKADDLEAAVAVLIGGSLTPGFEASDRWGDYWLAVEETRRQRGDVLVADDDGVVVGVCSGDHLPTLPARRRVVL
jgi:hypothetical protein